MNSFSQYKESYQEGKTLPQDFYTDESIFTDEMKAIYFKQWLMVDHVTRIKNPGDYFVFEAEKESVSFGLVKNVNTFNPMKITFMIWSDMYHEIKNSKNFHML